MNNVRRLKLQKESKFKYDDFIDLNILDPHSAHAQIIDLIESNKKVLEIGCATGYISRCLTKAKQCKVTGVEIDHPASQKAKQYCENIIIGNIEDDAIFAQIEGTYDIIVMAAVLEHLVNPEKVLTKIRDLINPSGYAIITLPNIANWKVRKEIVFGRFEYEDYGILDKGHLRFFTYHSAKRLIEKCGYDIEYFSVTGGFPGGDILRSIPLLGERLFRYLHSRAPNLLGYELIFKVRKLQR